MAVDRFSEKALIAARLSKKAIEVMDMLGPNRSEIIRQAVNDFFKKYLEDVTIEPVVRLRILNDPDALATWVRMIVLAKTGHTGIRVFRKPTGEIVNLVEVDD
jgi:hypothetical protein